MNIWMRNGLFTRIYGRAWPKKRRRRTISLLSLNEVADEDIEADNENNSIQIVYDYLVVI